MAAHARPSHSSPGDIEWVHLDRRSPSLQQRAAKAPAGIDDDEERQIDRLERALEEREFHLLEVQSQHVRVVQGLRKDAEASAEQLRAKEAEVLRLRRALQEAENATLSQALASEEHHRRLAQEIEHLQLKAYNVQLAATQATTTKDRAAAGHDKVRADCAALAARSEQLRKVLDEREAALASRDAQLAEIQAHAQEQSARVRALRDQLAEFIRKDASEAAHLQVRTSIGRGLTTCWAALLQRFSSHFLCRSLRRSATRPEPS